MVTKGNILHSGTTVSFSSSMTALDIQQQIDLMPKRLGGQTLTFDFTSGTYDLNTGINFSHFHGGILNIKGDQYYNAATIEKASVINFDAGDNFLSLDGLHCETNVSALKINGATTGAAVCVRNCLSPILIEGCITIMGTGSGYGIKYENSHSEARNNYLVSGKYGIYSEGGHIHVHNNSSSGDSDPNKYSWYGMWVDKGGDISKQSSSLHPSGITGMGSGNAGGYRE